MDWVGINVFCTVLKTFILLDCAHTKCMSALSCKANCLLNLSFIMEEYSFIHSNSLVLFDLIKISCHHFDLKCAELAL